MRLLVLLTDAFGSRGGIAKFNRDLLTALCDYPGETKVVALPRLMPEPPGALPAQIDYVARAAGAKWRFPVALWSVLRHRSPFDLVISAHLNLLPFAALAKRKTHAPLLQIIHGIDAWQPPANRWRRNAVKHLDALVSVSAFSRERFLSWSGLENKPSFLLPNCVDLARYGTGPKPTRLSERHGLRGRTVLLTLARLSAAERYKGVDQILEVLPRLAQDVPNLCYVIAGEGDDRERLVNKARSLGLQVTDCQTPARGDTSYDITDYVTSDELTPDTQSALKVPSSGNPTVLFTGHIPESEKADYLRLADAFVMPGWGEGFGIVYLEAMACGIPVVASQADASQEVIRQIGFGVTVNPKDPDDLRRGILESLRTPRGIVPEGLQAYTFDRYRERCHEILRTLVSASATQSGRSFGNPEEGRKQATHVSDSCSL